MGSKQLKLLLAVALVFILAFGLGGQALAANGAPEGNIRAIVVLDGPSVNQAAVEVLLARGGVVEKTLTETPFSVLVVTLPEKAMPAVAQAPGVLRVEVDAIVQALGKPTPPSQPTETLPWGVNQIDAELAWGTSTGASVNVAVIDTGIDKDHKDLIGNLKGGINFVAARGKVDPTKWDDDNGHGTHVAGIVAAVDNEIGVVGVAPKAYLWAVKVLNKAGSGYLSDVVNGIYWAKNHGMQVINMSLGTTADSATLKQACDDAYAAGIVVVAAAGNSGNSEGTGDNVLYPAKYDSVIAVSATDNTNTRASWSSTGPAVELATPGVNIYSTYNNGYYTSMSGTSMASPHVAGAAALVLASPLGADYDLNHNSMWDASEVRNALRNTADNLGSASWYGYGLVDAEEASTGIQSQ